MKDMLGTAVRKLVTLPAQTLGLVCDLLEKLSDEEWVSATKRFLRKENPWEAKAAGDVYPVTVDYGLSLSEMISAGEYNWVNEYITAKNFPMEGIGLVETEIHLLHFDRPMESGDVLKEMDKAGFRPATIAELLAFGAKYPKEQMKYPIIELGSVWRRSCGRRDVAGLWLDVDERDLGLYLFEVRWDSICRFAAVRK